MRVGVGRGGMGRGGEWRGGDQREKGGDEERGMGRKRRGDVERETETVDVTICAQVPTCVPVNNMFHNLLVCVCVCVLSGERPGFPGSVYD